MKLYTITEKSLYKLQRKKMDKIKSFLNDDRVQTALWIGLSQAVASVAAYLLTVPELAQYAGVINFIAYLIKSTNDKRKDV
jgi:hypothetical protein